MVVSGQLAPGVLGCDVASALRADCSGRRSDSTFLGGPDWIIGVLRPGNIGTPGKFFVGSWIVGFMDF